MEIKQCLNGLWDFAAGGESLYELPEKWAETKICVPSPFNINSFAHGYEKRSAGEAYYVQGADFRLYPEYERGWEKLSRGFYRRYLDISQRKKGRRLFLRFDAVAYRSVFYLNGKKVAEETEAFLPIEFEITDAVLYGGRNELIVGAETALVQNYKDENGRNRTDLPRGSFWGEHIGGIWQDCWLVERPQEYIKDVFAVTDVEEKMLSLRYEIAGGGQAASDAPVPSVCHGGEEMPAAGKIRFLLAKYPEGEFRVLGEGGISDGAFAWNYKDGEIEHWEPEDPALYRLKAELVRDGRTVDDKEIRIGFRTLRAAGEKFLFNGRPIRLKCDAWHYMGYAVQTPEYARSYYALAKKIGINIIRLHAQPFPEFFYDIADEMGMLLVDESAVWASHCCFSYNPAFFENSKKHLVRLVLRDRNHPSVVMWSPENECIPAYKVCGSPFIRDEADLEQKLYDFLGIIYEYDTSRLVSCDGSGNLGGRLPVNSLHYPGYDLCTGKGKPITIGEMGSMYYSTPDQVCMEYGQRVLESFEGRLLAVAADAYRNLMGERRWAEQVCVFNLVWYGLEPLPFQERLISYSDYTAPGIKPSRITPYLRTLNAGADENLPEYKLNPVGEMLMKAYREQWFYIENMPCGVYAGEAECLKAYVYNDTPQEKQFGLTARVVCGDAVWLEKTVCCTVKACSYVQVELAFAWEVPTGGCRLTLLLSCGEEEIASEQYEIHVYDRKRLWAQFKTLPIRNVETEEKEEVSVFFTAKWHYTARVKCKVSVLEKEGGDGVPVCFDGAGNPLVLAVYGQGGVEIVNGIPLEEKTDPKIVQMLCDVAAECGRKRKRVAGMAYFYGDDAGEAACMLKSVSCDYETVSRGELEALFNHRQDAVLILDGAGDLDVIESIGANNFTTVLVMNAKTVPRPFYHCFQVTDRQAFHLVPTPEAVTETGLYGTKLYGLAEGRELALSRQLLGYRDRENKAIYMEEPLVDWRMWNFNAEGLKTVSVHRGERKERSGFSAYSRHEYAGSSIYFAQFCTDPAQERLRYIWSCILTSLGAASGACGKEEKPGRGCLTQRELYQNGLQKMVAAQVPDKASAAEMAAAESLEELLCMAGGQTWRQSAGETGRCERVLLAAEVISGQERTDFLLNPDTVDMAVRSHQKAVCYLNGEFLGEGADITFPSVKLRRGRNILCCYMEEKSEMPWIEFIRKNGEALDLKFRI